jgi:hypothetical protein
VRVAAGDSVFAKIASFNSPDDTGASNELQTTFVVVLVDPIAARSEIGPLWYDARLAAGRAVALSDETTSRGGLRLSVPKASWGNRRPPEGRQSCELDVRGTFSSMRRDSSSRRINTSPANSPS